MGRERGGNLFVSFGRLEEANGPKLLWGVAKNLVLENPTLFKADDVIRDTAWEIASGSAIGRLAKRVGRAFPISPTK